MGFDFGLKRIGVAVGQHITRTATPVAVVNARDGIPDWPALDALVNEWQPALFVVGLPLHMDGDMSEMGKAADKFARRLHGRYKLEAKMMDERLSTYEAKSLSDETQVDALAAKLILESWLAD